MGTIILLTIIIANCIFFLKYNKDQRTGCVQSVPTQGNSSGQQSFFIETPFIKRSTFFLMFVSAQVTILSPIIAAIAVKWQLPVHDPSTFPYTQSTDIYADKNNIGIKTTFTKNASFHYEFSGYQVGEYEIDPASPAGQQILKFASGINSTLRGKISRNATIKIRITGQADGIPATKMTLFNGKCPIPATPFIRRSSGKIVRKGYMPQVSRLGNEDFARLRSYYTFDLFSSVIDRKGVIYELQSDISVVTGPAERKVEVQIYIEEAMDKSIYNFFDFQQELFNKVLML